MTHTPNNITDTKITDPAAGEYASAVSGWMREAACQDAPELPWIGPPGNDWQQRPNPRADWARMAEICHHCPVRAECETYVRDDQVTAGFWAGRWRQDRHDMPRQGRRAA